MNVEREIILPLSNGGTLRCGSGQDHAFGGYLRICDASGVEVVYWDKEEWGREPELVIGSVFASADKAMPELLESLRRTSIGADGKYRYWK